MRKTLALLALGVAVSVPSGALASERTVTLAVQNMYCAACPHIVKGSLQAVLGVESVAVSFRQKTATVTYDDAKTNVKALTAATTNAGYPSSPKS